MVYDSFNHICVIVISFINWMCKYMSFLRPPHPQIPNGYLPRCEARLSRISVRKAPLYQNAQ